MTVPDRHEPVRVLHLITRLIVGGAQENTLYTAARLDQSHYKVEVLCGPQTGSEGSLIETAHADGLSLTILPDLVRQVSPVHDLRALAALVRRMRAGRYQILHTHSSKAGILGRAAARLARVPVVVHTVHGWSFHNYMSPAVQRAYILLERSAARSSDALIAVAQGDIEKGLKAGIGCPEQYHLIRSAIPLEAFDPDRVDRGAVRAELGLPADAVVIGNIGRFSEQKNPLEWVEVAAQVLQMRPGCRFLLVGDGPLRAAVEAALEAHGLSEWTIMTGLRRDVARLLGAIDIFLLTSRWEGLPRVIPQALAMGVPAVASRAGGIAEAIQEGQTGFLCDPGDVLGLAGRCVDLVDRPELRWEMGQRGRSFAQQEFNLDEMIARIEGLYEQLLDLKKLRS